MELPDHKDEDRLKRTLYVGGLDEMVTPAVLQAAFVPFGELRSVDIPVDRAAGKSRGFGFVEFEEEADAKHAVDNMNQSEVFGRVITVNQARSSGRRITESSRPAWADDFFFRRKLAEQGLDVNEAVNQSSTAVTTEVVVDR
eukprot:Lankesteria_metandrocarpae@DN9082_c0_g1_i1.p1